MMDIKIQSIFVTAIDDELIFPERLKEKAKIVIWRLQLRVTIT